MEFLYFECRFCSCLLECVCLLACSFFDDKWLAVMGKGIDNTLLVVISDELDYCIGGMHLLINTVDNCIRGMHLSIHWQLHHLVHN